MIKNRNKELEIKKIMAKMSDTDESDWYLVTRARHSLEVIFRSINSIRPKTEVITQPFTCVTAINPILTAGLKPIYADIKRDTLTINPLSVKELLTTASSAVVVQNTFGIDANIKSIKDKTESHEIVIVEDSAHCLGKISREAHVSVHSFGSEKVLKTSFGSAVWVNPTFKDELIGAEIIKNLNNLSKMNYFEDFKFAIYPYLNKIVNKIPAFIGTRIKETLKNLKIMITPIMPQELNGRNILKPKKLSNHQIDIIFKNLSTIEENIANRISTAQEYLKMPSELKLKPSTLYVRFPLLARSANDADDIFKQLRRLGFESGKWYRPLFFPGVNYSKYFYKEGSCPVAEECSKLIVNLPTNVSNVVARKIVDEIKNIRA